MTKAEAWDIFEHFRRCCICVGAVAPSTFWSTINNFPCYHHIGNEIRDLNDYIKNCGDTKLAIAIDEFICAYQAGDEDIYNVLLVMAYYADDMESEIAQEIQVGVEYLQKIHEWLMITEFKVNPQRVFDYRVKNGKLTQIKRGKPKRYKSALPREFNNELALAVLQKAKEKGLYKVVEVGYRVCNRWMLGGKVMLAYFAVKCSTFLGLDNTVHFEDGTEQNQTNYPPFELYFDVKNLRTYTFKERERTGNFLPVGHEQIDSFFDELEKYK